MFELKKIGIVRRASAWLLDAILLSVLSVGFIYLISLICNYSKEEKLANEYYGAWETFREEEIGKVASFYGFTYTVEEGGDYTIEKDGVEKTIEDVVDVLVASEGKDEETAAAYERYLTLPPVKSVNGQYFKVHNLLFMMTSIGLLLGYAVLEFVLPLCLKNGQTVGKKVFGICLIRPDCVKITTLSLFARTFLGKFAIETMFPVLMVFLFFFGGLGLLAIVLFAAILLLNLILFFATKNRTPIHDLLAGTVAADMRVQMIFSSEEELIEKKKEAHMASVEASRSE